MNLFDWFLIALLAFSTITAFLRGLILELFSLGGLIAGICLLIARRRTTAQAHADYMEAVTIGDGVVPVSQSLWRSISSLWPRAARVRAPSTRSGCRPALK